MMIYNNLINK